MPKYQVECRHKGTKSTEKVTENDLIDKITGSMGRYQIGVCLLMSLLKFTIELHQMAIIFLAPKTSYVCEDTGNASCPCSRPVYDTSIFTQTIITKWDLICDKQWLVSLAQTLFQLGTLTGSVFFGMASDRFGRNKPLAAAVVLQVFSGIGASFMESFWIFCFLRFLVGMGVGGALVCGFVYAIETVGTDNREIISILHNVPFNVGYIALPAFGYYFRDFSKFQLVISSTAIFFLIYILIPESQRWLLAVKKTEKAIEVLERIARVNNRPTENIRVDVELHMKVLERTKMKKGNILDLFRTTNLRKNTLAMAWIWFSLGYCFYGVAQYVGQLNGDVFINILACAFIVSAGLPISVLSLKFMGRRQTLMAFNLVSASCLLLQAMIPEGACSVVLASVGIVCSYVVFVVAYLYCCELFPTVVRNSALGFSSMMARIGSMLAPFIIQLDYLGTWVPCVGFAVPPLVSVFMAMLIPETKGCALLTTIEEGENFRPSKIDLHEIKRTERES